MFALERLLDHASIADDHPEIEVDAFEPHAVPGAGPVYDPRQPDHLRMNFTAGQVDMWWPGSTAVPAHRQRSFVDWCAERGRPRDAASYPARAEVGRYLAGGLETLLAHAPPNVRVTVHKARVRTVSRAGGGWTLTTSDALPEPPYDEVLLAIGHDRSWDGSLTAHWRGPAPLSEAVFPVERWLSPARVPPGAAVAIRGFALSFIDAALALTEGRGGSFEPREDAKRARPEEAERAAHRRSRLVYRPGREDVAVMLPFSRTGRPMLAKPEAGLAQEIPGLAEIAAGGRRRIACLGGPVELHRDLMPILATTTRAMLVAARGAAAHVAGVDGWLEGAAAGVPLTAGENPEAELRRSLAVGAGLLPPDLSWALGQTWRGLYPAVVARLGGDRLSTTDWPAFRRLTAELERMAFGPPPINVAKILALVDAGRVDLTHLRGGRLGVNHDRTVLESERGRQPVDVVVDAVLPGPGAPPGQNLLLRRLLADGHARIAAGRRGIDVGPDGSARRVDGSTTLGLAAIGRPTEDSVIGNDTLSRTLHPISDRWARRIVERSRATRPSERLPVCAGITAAGRDVR
jgi:diaminopimelate decarboxylase